MILRFLCSEASGIRTPDNLIKSQVFSNFYLSVILYLYFLNPFIYKTLAHIAYYYRFDWISQGYCRGIAV